MVTEYCRIRVSNSRPTKRVLLCRRVEKQPFVDVRHAEIAAFPQHTHDDYGETRPK